MTYNLTNLTNGGTLLTVFTVANEVTSGWFGLMILFSTFIISLVSLMQVSDKKTAFATSSFLTFIIGLMLRTAGLIVNDTVMVIIICMLVGSIVILYSTD